MSTLRIRGRRDFSQSPFPLRPRWGVPRRSWHTHYPHDVPPGIDFRPTRVEQLLVNAAQYFPDRVALRYHRTHWTYSELLNRTQQVASNLLRLGVQPGHRVMLVLPNCPEFVTAWFALHWIGAEVIQANPLLCSKDLTYLATQSQTTAVIGLDFRLEAVLEMARECHVPLLIVSSLSSHLPLQLRWPYRVKCWLQDSPYTLPRTDVYMFDELFRSTTMRLVTPLQTSTELPAVLQPTGGTTGTPKIAVLTHKNLQSNVAQLHAWSGLSAGQEVVLSVLPFFHVFGSTVALLSSIAGGSTLLLHANFNPSRIWNDMKKWQPNVAPMVPFMFASLCEEMKRRNTNITGLEYCFSGAAPLNCDVKSEFQERTGALILEGFGLSEASPVTHVNHPGQSSEIGGIGLPLPDTQARIVDTATGLQTMPPGEVGELIVRGPQVMSEYLDDPRETEHVLRDGWLYTGDLARVDQHGFFTLVDRKKDMIISGGLNIYPNEVESVLQAHPAVNDCSVVGLPHPKFGESVVAFVVLESHTTVSVENLKTYCQQHLAAYKIP
ncbi:MAG: AMP-binding protein, partial [Planctomycetaceae bacterium]